MEVDCVGVVSESSGGGFVMVVVLEDFGVLWCGGWLCGVGMTGWTFGNVSV